MTTVSKGRAYDLALFEELNERYRDRPLVPRPPKPDPGSLEKSAARKLRTIKGYLDPAGKDVLELGTGRGWLGPALLDAGARSVVGVDIREYPDWAEHRRLEGLTLLVADLAVEEPLPHESVDAIVSAAVFEHVQRPLQMLTALHRLLRPGGRAWLHFNLHRGRKASHKYREVFFPWPHLLFENDVCRAFYRKHYDRSSGFSWVNRMTMAHYVQTCTELGFEVRELERRATPVEADLDFYLEFRDKLGRYPVLDLETDFLTMVVEKAERPSGVVPVLGYAERQLEFESSIDR